MAKNTLGISKLSVLAIAVSVLFIAAVLGILVLLNWTPQFYRQVGQLPGEGRELEAKQFLNRASQLANDVRRYDHWEAVFTEEQINGWLAEEFAELAGRYATIESAGLDAPRVSLGLGELRAGMARTGRFFSVIVWLRAQIWVAEPGTVALRVRDLRVGALPLPINRVHELAEMLARRGRATIEWRQIDGDPVALINLDMHDALGNLRRIEVADGRLLVSSTDAALAIDRALEAGGGAR